MCSSGSQQATAAATPAAAPAPPAAPPQETAIGAAREVSAGYADAPNLRVDRKTGPSTVAGAATAGGSGLRM